MGKNQLTKSQLQNVSVGTIITENYYNQDTNWEVKKNENHVLHLHEVNGKRRTKLTVDGNFNSIGDRRYKSPNGQVIVKYYIDIQDDSEV